VLRAKRNGRRPFGEGSTELYGEQYGEQYGLTGRVGATPFYDGPPTFLPVQAHPRSK